MIPDFSSKEDEEPGSTVIIAERKESDFKKRKWWRYLSREAAVFDFQIAQKDGGYGPVLKEREVGKREL